MNIQLHPRELLNLLQHTPVITLTPTAAEKAAITLSLRQHDDTLITRQGKYPCQEIRPGSAVLHLLAAVLDTEQPVTLKIPDPKTDSSLDEILKLHSSPTEGDPLGIFRADVKKKEPENDEDDVNIERAQEAQQRLE